VTGERLAEKPFTAEGWLFELKHDGFRAFVRSRSAVEFLSHNGRSVASLPWSMCDTAQRPPSGLTYSAIKAAACSTVPIPR
jgi:ATP-dependent DNA ligase